MERNRRKNKEVKIMDPKQKRQKTYLLRNVPVSTYRLFKSRCAIDGVKMREALITFMETYGENIKY